MWKGAFGHVCICVPVRWCVCFAEFGRIENGRQPSSKRGAMPAASIPRDAALKVGSEAGQSGEAPVGHGTVTQAAYVR